MKFKLLNDGARLPTFATPGSAGYDVYADEDIVIPAWDEVAVSTGITAQFSSVFALKIASRSGLRFKHKVESFHGTIDSDYYPGEIKILMINNSENDFEIKKGDKISQLLMLAISRKIPAPVIDTKRTGGFGSTDKESL